MVYGKFQLFLLCLGVNFSRFCGIFVICEILRTQPLSCSLITLMPKFINSYIKKEIICDFAFKQMFN